MPARLETKQPFARSDFAEAFVQKNAELRASLFAENGTFVTPTGDFLQRRVAMVKDFAPEAQQAVNGSTQAAFWPSIAVL
jgi:hypothetical protein